MDYYVPDFGVDTDIKTSLNNMNNLESTYYKKLEAPQDEEEEADAKPAAKKVAADVKAKGARVQRPRRDWREESYWNDAEDDRKAQEAEEKATADKSEEEKEAEAEEAEEKKAQAAEDAEKRASKKRAMKKEENKTLMLPKMAKSKLMPNKE